ncbi:MAG: elongation factor P maturation arginine rhamnosyltransferase EarP [Proteobacteria bacterium]|nr:elongation factor P maturation arginine rhamnosyltransferase EarP [Pseudomonadota bacterium]
MTFLATLAIFCKVVDNYGDIGICWRLARQLRQEHGIAVTLWVDDLHSFRRINPAVAADVGAQQVDDVSVLHWRDQEGVFALEDIADIVIEFFGCDIPPGYIAAMALCHPRPVWLNLEGLTAEEWVEGCHTLPSMHPRLPLTKYFFYPGFTDKTGGLLHEADLEAQRRQFQSDSAVMATFLESIGVAPMEMAALKVSLFCYPQAPISALFAAWQGGDTPIVCLVPEGVATEAVETFLGAPAKAGAAQMRGALIVRVLPFIAQSDYDRLLWACDLNFVRGEDSFVRAQWAGKPFIWHIYPQDKNLHHKKLRAFLQRYAAGSARLDDFVLWWNDVVGVADVANLWESLQTVLPLLGHRTEAWSQQVQTIGDLAGNLLAFAAAKRSEAAENKV